MDEVVGINDYFYEDYLVDGELCDICKTIPWERLFREVYEDHVNKKGSHELARSSEFELGHLSMVPEKKTCSFCRFIRRSTFFNKTDKQVAQEHYTINLQGGKFRSFTSWLI